MTKFIQTNVSVVRRCAQPGSRFIVCTAICAMALLPTGLCQAALLDTAVAQWQFASFETLGTGINGTGTATATQNNTGTLNDVRDLNGNQSWLTRYFNGAANGATVGNAIAPAAVQAVNSDLLSLNANTGSNYLIRDLSSAGEELIPTTNTSYTVFARVLDQTFSGVDDIFHVGAWSDANNNSYALQTNNGAAQFRVRGAGQGSDSILSGPVLNTGKWYDITGVFDSVAQQMSLYVYDPQTGLQVGATTTLAGLGFGSLSAGTAGNNTRNGGLFFAPGFANGTNDGARADLVAVWNLALTQSEVASLSALPPAPEPSTMVLLSLGCIAVAARRKKGQTAPRIG